MMATADVDDEVTQRLSINSNESSDSEGSRSIRKHGVLEGGRRNTDREEVTALLATAGQAFPARNPIEHNNSNLHSLMNILKGNIGTGILALPTAFRYGGLWVSFIGIFILAVIAVHCVHLLVKSARVLCQRTGRVTMDYGDVVEASFVTGPPRLTRFAPLAKFILNLFLCITQLGFCTVYILFVSDNVIEVIRNYSATFSLSDRVFAIFIFIALMPYVCVRNLRTLAHFSMFANILICIGLVIVLQFCFRDLPSIADRPAFGGWNTFPLFFGIAVYAFEGIGVIMPIENKMRTPMALTGWNGVINVGMTIVTALYAGVGFFGYLKIGENTKGSITLNLPCDWYYMAVRLLFAVGIFISYGLQFYVPIDILWPICRRAIARHGGAGQCSTVLEKYGEYILRFTLLTLTFILAATIPQLGLMISLIGALSSSAVALIIPPIIDFVTIAADGPITRMTVFKNSVIIFIGVVGFVIGTITTIISIVDAFKNPPNSDSSCLH